MTLREMKEILDGEIIVGQDQLDLDVKTGGCADLMADVLFYGKAGMVLLTGLTNPHVVHTAQTLGIPAIILVRGKQPPPETIRLAEKLNIPLLLTDCLLFEAIGRLYVGGLESCMKKVGDRTELL